MAHRPGFNGGFFLADPRFWPLERAARRFAAHDDFPRPEELSTPEVRFVRGGAKPRRAQRAAVSPEERYDAQAAKGVVPTRPGSWHDFLNALVWATFPTSKRILHELQAAAVTRGLTPDGKLPNARTREQDALALLDEGGVIELTDTSGALVLGFGHALYEGLVRRDPPATASCLTFTVATLPDRADAPSVADRLLSARLREPLRPEALSRRPF